MSAYQRELARQQRQADRDRRVEDARTLAAAFEHILTLHRAEFPVTTRPLAAPPASPDTARIAAHYERQALRGIGVLKRGERAQARQRAAAWTQAEAARQRDEQVRGYTEHQRYLDHLWRQLSRNVPAVVMDTLQEAFEDNEVPSTAVGVEGDTVSLVVLVPGIDAAVPERWPTLTPAGNLSLKKLGKRERSDYYTIFVCAQVLVTVREAFAVAPGLRSARVTALRADGPGAYGRPSVSCLLAAVFDRTALDGVRWESASAVEILNGASRERILRQSGQARELTPIDLSSHPDLAELVRAIDLSDLDRDSSTGRSGGPDTMLDPRRSPATPPSVPAQRDATSSYAVSPTEAAVGDNRLGDVTFVVVLVAAALAVIPATAVFGFLVCLCAIVPAFIAFWRTRKGRATNPGRARAALIMAPIFFLVGPGVGASTTPPPVTAAHVESPTTTSVPATTTAAPRADATATPTRTTTARHASTSTTTQASSGGIDLPDVNVPNPDLPGHAPQVHVHIGGGGHHRGGHFW